jgi:hypothetical protein
MCGCKIILNVVLKSVLVLIISIEFYWFGLLPIVDKKPSANCWQGLLKMKKSTGQFERILHYLILETLGRNFRMIQHDAIVISYGHWNFWSLKERILCLAFIFSLMCHVFSACCIQCSNHLWIQELRANHVDSYVDDGPLYVCRLLN